MKSFIICTIAVLISVAGFSQKAKANADTTLKTYMTVKCILNMLVMCLQNARYVTAT